MTSSSQAAEIVAILNLKAAATTLSPRVPSAAAPPASSVSRSKLGIGNAYVDPYASDEAVQAFPSYFRAIFGETIANPALTVSRHRALRARGPANWGPLIVDNTFPTAVLCRPSTSVRTSSPCSTSMPRRACYFTQRHDRRGQQTLRLASSGKFGRAHRTRPCHGTVYTDAFGPSCLLSKPWPAHARPRRDPFANERFHQPRHGNTAPAHGAPLP